MAIYPVVKNRGAVGAPIFHHVRKHRESQSLWYDERDLVIHKQRLCPRQSMRLYPPAWALTGRMAAEDDQIGGFTIPAGGMVFISPYIAHRDARFWPDPERFDPERFSPEQSAARPRYAYIPFGGGPRLCIGNSFAMTEAQIILAMVAQRYRLRLQPGYDIVPDPIFTLRVRGGLPMTLKRVSAL